MFTDRDSDPNTDRDKYKHSPHIFFMWLRHRLMQVYNQRQEAWRHERSN